MAKKPINNFSEEFFLQRGYTKNDKGGYDPPKFKNPMTSPQAQVAKIKVNNSIDFDYMPKLEWFIPYQVPSKKNCQQLFIRRTQGGKMIPSTTTSARYKEYISVTKNYWEIFGKEFRNSIDKLGLCKPYLVEFTFIRSTKQKVDYVGPLESCQDIMQDFGWIENDDAYTLKPILGDLEVDKENPGVRIKLLKK